MGKSAETKIYLKIFNVKKKKKLDFPNIRIQHIK